MNKRVVITGIGVVASNGTGISNFLSAIRGGKSGIDFLVKLLVFQTFRKQKRRNSLINITFPNQETM
jgi:3-oxoacyl-(acyl-carrier-protein) synthase